MIRIILLLLCSFITTISFTQNAVCYAITTQGDTIKGIYQNFKKDELRIWTLANKEKIAIPADSLKEYTLYETGEKPVIYEPIKRFLGVPGEGFSIVGIFKKEEEFAPMVRLAAGKFYMYRYEHLETSFMPSASGGSFPTSYTKYYYYISYDKKQFTPITSLDALKPKIFDCPELVAKIGTKGYNKFAKHVEKIMDEYNSCK